MKKSTAIAIILIPFVVVATARAQSLRRLPPIDTPATLHVASASTRTQRHNQNAAVLHASYCTPCPDGEGTCPTATDSISFVPWSTTEIQFQYGRLCAPSFAGGAKAETSILTFQHVSGWKYGDNFFFVDLVDDRVLDGFNDRDVYMEWYTNLSLGKILRREIGCGILADIGIIGGINYAPDANIMKWLPGVRLDWELPGFAYLHSDFTAFIDDNGGTVSGGAPRETDSFMIDLSWDYLFSMGQHDFSIQGHAEFIGNRKNEFGNDVSWWIFAQPQFRYDLGKTILCSPNQLFVGIEWQIWPNKLGDHATNENAVQALVVWRL